MSQSKEDNSTRGNDLPTVSGPTFARSGYVKAPPPRIEGYEVLGELGEAGQGQVWRARQLSTRREVALKVPRVELLSSKKVLARFEREVELAARLRHPYIAGIYDSGIYQGLYYYAMELIEGMPLDEYVRHNDLTERQTAELMRNICQAVSHAHQNGVIHRDIKPSNIMVTEDGRPHVLDFGLAMNILEADASGTVSVAGEVTGTPAYMSPEQATGKRDRIDTRTDVYSIGVVFYRVLTGSFPYDVKTSMLETLRNIQENEPIKPSKVLGSIDSDIEAIVLKALAKEPEQRYQSAAEMQSDIERWLNGLPILAKADNSLYLLRKMINKHRYAASILALLAIIVLGYATVVIQLYGRVRRSNTELNIVIDSLHEQLSGYTELVRLELLDRLLGAWHRNDSVGVEYVASTFKNNFREDKAARLLAAQMTEQTSLEKKLGAFRKVLEADEPAFMEFLVGEHYLKSNRKTEAEQAYRRCLASLKPNLSREQWLAVRARSRLFVLTEEAGEVGKE
ncbi:MAG: serine/threonine protein kinase [Planctomycetota bacterium]|jgi:serine/threonine protein kinase